MRTHRNLIAVFIIVLVTGCATTPIRTTEGRHLPLSHYDALEAAGHRVITFEELAASLPDSSVDVGFDIDDTILFSSPGFYYATTNSDGSNGTNRFGDNPLNADTFWTTLNTKLDDFSIPKHIAQKLIALHKKRGDTVHFVTARPCPSNDPAPLTQRLNKLFGLTNQHPIVFTNQGEKTTALRQRQIKIFYGDSDGDIKDAKAAGARAIRIVRSPLSTNPSATHDGALGEEVLFDSEN